MALIKVLHVMNTLDIGGAEALVLNLAKRIDGRRFALEVVSLTGEGKLSREFRALGVPTHALDRREGLDPTLAFRLGRLAKAIDAHILHSHNVGPWLYGGLAALALRRPLVHTEHSNLFAGQRALMYAERALAYGTHTVIADSSKVHRHLVERQGLPARKVRTIMNGIDTQLFSPDAPAAAAREALGVPAQALVVGTVGRLVPVKDQDSLLHAFAQVAPTTPQARLVVVGEGPLRAQLEAQASGLGIRERVHFAGGRRDVHQLLPAFDVFVLSSISEGLPLTVLEAMACGLPVISTDVGALKEAVENGQTGLLVPSRQPAALAQAIGTLLGHPERRRSMGEAALTRVRGCFDLRLMTQSYEGVYDAARSP